MNRKLLYIIIILLVVIIAGGAFFLFGNKLLNNKEEAGGQPMPSISSDATPSFNPDLSEQPNMAKYNEFFTSIFLAKLPAGAAFEPFKIVKTGTFNVGEQFCTSLNMKKQIPANTLSSAVYDVNEKQNIQPRAGAFPQAMGPGNSTGCQPLSQIAGQYEYKIYINDDLIAVLPFEVK